MIFEIGVGAEGLKHHLQQYLKEFREAVVIRINPAFDNLHQDNGIFHLAFGVKEAFVGFSKK